MSDSPLGLAEALDCMKHLQRVFEQEKFFERFVQAKATVAEFLDYLEAIRLAYVTGERDIRIEPERFRDLVMSCENGFLLNVPEEIREPLRLEAGQSAMTTAFLPNAGTIKLIALVDLRIKTLIVLVLQSLSSQYQGESRHQDWDRVIAEAESELETSCKAWRGVN